MREIIVKTLASSLKTPVDEIDKILEVPKEESRGDYALPCFAFARILKKNPLVIAQEIAKMKLPKGVLKAENVGPYVNFFLDQSVFAVDLVDNIIKQGESYGQQDLGKRKNFMIEFSQPNTHKAFHVGHIRGTCFGESLARIRSFCGYKVIRANYSGDTGMHIAKWMWAYTKFHSKEKISDNEKWFANIYVEAVGKLEGNEKAEEEVAEINKKLDAKSDAKLMKLWKETRKKSIAAWKPIYEDLDVKFDQHFFESEVEKAGKEIAQELTKKKIAEISDEATIMNFKDQGLGVWVLLRKDGTVLYSAKDLALAELKFKNYKIDESLIITSVEQNLHFQQLRATLERMKFPKWQSYLHMGYESVRFPWGKMSSRTGDNVFYADFREELVEEAGKEVSERASLSKKELTKRAEAIAMAAMKYPMLKQDIHKIIIFDKKEALRFEGDTGPYLLYSYVRAHSILKSAEKMPKTEDPKSLGEDERLLVNLLGRFPEAIKSASDNLTPAPLAHYTYELAQKFNAFYHSSKVLGSETAAFRLRLVKSFTIVLGKSLDLLGIKTIKEM